MAKFITIGERLSTTAPAVNKAFSGERCRADPEESKSSSWMQVLFTWT